MKKIIVSLFLLLPITVSAYDRVGPPTDVESVYMDVNSSTFVIFGENGMPDCWSNKGAYLPTGQNNSQAKIVSILLSAKATGQKIQVYYNINEGGSGWSMCTIHAVQVK